MKVYTVVVKRGSTTDFVLSSHLDIKVANRLADASLSRAVIVEDLELTASDIAIITIKDAKLKRNLIL
tara:strand:+ start:10902 stop:11105 length:204 start_codon:yes stop_codon:yes gene_type:complete